MIKISCGTFSKGSGRNKIQLIDLGRSVSEVYFDHFCVIHRVDKDRSGAISTDELQQALSNGMLHFDF